ncbi:MAG: hypothetical protein DRI89_02505 [Bacteroidetes bacterium]|nr:MAG: hypothetical protein DRI89_02505 [Bacteroidota bacterium]
MTTITIDKEIKLAKTHFKDLEEFQLHILQIQEQSELSTQHKSILDARLVEADKNTDGYINLDELKSSIRRK